MVNDPTFATGLGVVALVLVAIALVLIAWSSRRAARLDARLDSLTRGVDGTDLGTVLERHLDTVMAVSRELETLGARTLSLEDRSRYAFQGIGLVRFNPYEDTGGNQSFALALLDANADGIVVSSLHARSGTRIYAKAVNRGRSDAALSAEETEALRLAMTGPPRPGTPAP